MKLSEIVAELKSLKDTVASFIGDKTKATADALTSFQVKLSTFETGALAELSAAKDAATEAIATATAAAAQVTQANAALDAALLEFKVSASGSPAEKVSALKGAVASAVAACHVPSEAVPIAKSTVNPTATQKANLTGHALMVSVTKIAR